LKLLVLFSSYFVFMTSVALADVGFSSGNKFTASPIRGHVTVTCADGSSVRYSCRDNVLEPESYDYFIGPQGVSADMIRLDSVRADGSHRQRSSSYNGKDGRSVDAFNLWISTLFQRPLLLAGVNKVTYALSNAGKAVSQGTVVVNVDQGAARECPATHYNSADAVDCQSQYTVCQRYFEQYQFCR